MASSAKATLSVFIAGAYTRCGNKGRLCSTSIERPVQARDFRQWRGNSVRRRFSLYHCCFKVLDRSLRGR
jgi:hypothetical protein